ncbi:MAG: hypothetical protein IT161_06975 [Bryobacterales bacterium]|nr:hypothetical protein [Bryobacterales bacterium]
MPAYRCFLPRLAYLSLAAASVLAAEPPRLDPKKMSRVGSVDERFQSYNVEMVEVTGGRFWAPYRQPSTAQPAPPVGGSAAGLDPGLFRQREPIDLGGARLRKLASALAPAYVRVSGTWANSTYFHDSDGPPPATPPPGFGSVLTRAQWKGVVDFSKAVNARIVTSFAVSPGVRDSNGVWTPALASRWVKHTASLGGEIAAAEMFNEPNFATVGGAPKGYDAAAYGRDFRAFLAFARRELPKMIVLGPGSVGDNGLVTSFPKLKSEDMLAASGRGVDAFSYHFYGAVSKRCGSANIAALTTIDAALTEPWLSRTEKDTVFYAALRDQFEPGKPLWLTETGETACGGNPWASTFADSFRYVEQLGRLAKLGVQVVAHNTLAASDYALIDEETMMPRPNYWTAVLWRRLMGASVLEASSPPREHIYAHCLRDHPGGVALLAVNIDKHAPLEIAIPAPSERYTLTAPELTSGTVLLNGSALRTSAAGDLPAVRGKAAPAGTIELPPASITFLAVPSAGNAACK